MSDKPARKLRCAIYTRKSSEEGLEQSFNSLQAQREACEAYIRSQAGEGWTTLKTVYDDGGFSGGTMDRPALKVLLADIEAGLVDTVVVYKVDRLTRSLHDFARIVQVFDAANVSFVSITQAFNTTTSMGRLTLNVLLSFAQFEREVTGERIRDKIAQSKAKGMWMGGNLPLGYDAGDHTLVINAAEAETVRAIFSRYLELGSVYALQQELEQRGVKSKSRTTRKGKVIGGQTFAAGALYHLLQNRHYRGLITHKEQAFPGLHPAIIEAELFDQAQALLASNRITRSQSRRGNGALLTGRLFDDRGRPYTPSFSTGRGRKSYRYYIAKGQSKPSRLPADDLEQFVLAQLARFAGGTADAASVAHLHRVEVRAETLQLVIERDLVASDSHPELALAELKPRLQPTESAIVDAGGRLRVSLPMRLSFRGGRTWLTGIQTTAGLAKPKLNAPLVRALKEAHGALAELGCSVLVANARPSGPSAAANTYRIRLAKLALLAPDIQLDIVQGRIGRGLSVKTLIAADIPIAWERQRSWIRTMAGG